MDDYGEMATAATDRMGFGLSEAARLSRLSEGQLRRWARDLYGASWQSGLYSFKDLVALRTLSRLRALTSRQELLKAGKYLREQYEAPWSRLRFGIGPKKRVYYSDPETGTWLSADAIQQSVMPIVLAEIAEELERDVRKRGERDPSTIGRLVRNRGICGGKERFAGTRIPAATVRAMLSNGVSEREILSDLPTLTQADIALVRGKLAVA